MLTVQTVMLVALGALLATLMALALAPAYRNRVRRLTSAEIRASLPLTESEVRADRDRLRAENAIQVHRLEVDNEQARLSAARQRIEINRRDASISLLERELTRIRVELEAKENACHVLEQTIADRVPRVEKRLGQAQSLLESREAELERLQEDKRKTYSALDEAIQINAQLQDEVERLKSALTTRSLRNRRDETASPFEGELALRSELEALRARTRDQSSLIDTLQRAIASAGRAGDGETAPEELSARSLATNETARLEAEIARLEEVVRKLDAARSESDADRAATLVKAESRIESQAREIATLKASIAAFEAGLSATGTETQAGESRVALKARVSALEVESAQQGDTVRRLRAELAAANDRYSRLAQRQRDEMRRQGDGTRLAGGPRPAASRADDQRRRSLAQRIGEAVPSTAPQLIQSGLVGGRGAASPPPSRPPANDEAAPAAAPETVEAPAARRPSRLLERIARLERAPTDGAE